MNLRTINLTSFRGTVNLIDSKGREGKGREKFNQLNDYHQFCLESYSIRDLMVVYPVPTRSIMLNIEMDYEKAEDKNNTNIVKEDVSDGKGREDRGRYD